MTKEELFFKENFPEYVTEKGECLSPYWDLFSAGVICATFELNNEIAELKAYNEKLLDGDIEKHNKIVELKARLNAINLLTPELQKASNLRKQQLTKAKKLLEEIIDTPVFTQMGGELYENEGYTELVEEIEQFLKESK